MVDKDVSKWFEDLNVSLNDVRTHSQTSKLSKVPELTQKTKTSAFLVPEDTGNHEGNIYRV
jgi:hypothetical protein